MLHQGFPTAEVLRWTGNGLGGKLQLYDIETQSHVSSRLAPPRMPAHGRRQRSYRLSLLGNLGIGDSLRPDGRDGQLSAVFDERNGSRDGLQLLPSGNQGPGGSGTIAGGRERSVRGFGVFADLRDEVVLEPHRLDQVELRFEPVDVLF
jgi:hypothetical protein